MSGEVDHPSHYTQNPAGVECWDVAQHMNFNLGNALKYIWRAGLKTNTPAADDLRKARNYIDHELARIGRAS